MLWVLLVSVTLSQTTRVGAEAESEGPCTVLSLACVRSVLPTGDTFSPAAVQKGPAETNLLVSFVNL